MIGRLASVIGPREVVALVGSALLWWGLHAIYRPAAPLVFGALLLVYAFGGKRSR